MSVSAAGCLIRGGPVDLLAVDLVPIFPTARLLHIRAIDGGRQFTVLVPDDFSPLILHG